MRVEKCTCEEGHMTTPKARMKTHGSQAQRFMKGETCSERPTMPLMITSTSTAAKSSRAAFQSGSDRYHPTGPGRAARPHCSQGLQATSNYLSANRAGTTRRWIPPPQVISAVSAHCSESGTMSAPCSARRLAGFFAGNRKTPVASQASFSVAA